MTDPPLAVANKRLKGIALGHKKSAGQFGVGAFALRAVPPYSFWTGGISNPLEVMEQITYLLFLRRLDDLFCAPAWAAPEATAPPTRST